MESKMFSNIRLGYATNSSSSHSMILLKEGEKISNSFLGMYDDLDFGWNKFTLATPEAKLRYIWCHLAEGLGCRSIYENQLLADKLLGTDLADPERDEYNIDHQSRILVPRAFGDETNINHYVSYLLSEIVNNDNVVILGGNDNGEEGGHILLNSHRMQNIFPFFVYDSDAKEYNKLDPVFRYDYQGYLTFFDNGNKYRTNIQPSGLSPTYSCAPELIDVKITNYCTKGCPFCMEDSNERGKHANKHIIGSIAYQMGRYGVFEAALGGGEPTSHPDFCEILEHFKYYGVVPNFSTGTMDWLQNKEISDAVSKYCGAVAYSTNNPDEAVLWVKKASKIIDKPVIHYIVGLDDNLPDLLDALTGKYGIIESRVILLGLKNRGRSTQSSNGNWWEVLKDKKYNKWLNGYLAIDTQLVHDVKENMPNVNPQTYEISDGRFSMYYDAVEQTASASSHTGKKYKVSPSEIIEGWNQILNEQGVR